MKNDLNTYVNNLRRLYKLLPQPHARHKSGNLVLEIYQVKKMFETQWPEPALKRIMVSARKASNLPYGRPIFDKYDKKSTIYLARALYPLDSLDAKSPVIDEWLSVRLVPGNGVPKGTGELEMFTFQNQKIEDVIQKKLCRGNNDYLSFFAASNRMCAHRPYFYNQKDQELMGIEMLPKKNRYSFLLYGLINFYFLRDYLKDGGYRFLTGVIIDELVEKALTTIHKGQRLGTLFTNAYEILGVQPDDIKLNRSARGAYTYHYPTYFLNVRSLIQWLQKLLHQKIISKKTIRHYIGKEIQLEQILQSEKIPFEKLKTIKRLFMEKGVIAGSKLTGKELRILADIEVGDGPKLRITELTTLEHSVRELLRAFEVSNI